MQITEPVMTSQQSSIEESYILAIDDDPTVGPLLGASLGLPAKTCASLEEFANLKVKQPPLATFVDIHLGLEENGLSILPDIKKRWPYNPVFVITSDAKDESLEEAFKVGADDFLTKPIREKEVKARFSTRLTDLQDRANQTTLGMVDVTLNLSHRVLTGPLGKRSLAPVETLILAQLIKAQGTMVLKEVLKREAWGVIKVSDNAFYRKVFELRRTLSEVTNSLSIRAVYGYGLKLEVSH